jgi:hypothetical protein
VQWDVVIAGYRLNAREPAAKALERILQLTPEGARKLARSYPTTVLTGGSQAAAEQLAEELREAGAVVELRASQAGERASHPAGPHPGLPLPSPRASLPARSAPATTRELASERGAAKLRLGEHELILPDTLQGAEVRSRAEPGVSNPHASPAPLDTHSGQYQLGDFGLERPREASSKSQTRLPAVSDARSRAEPLPSPDDMSLGRSFNLEDMRAVHSFTGAGMEAGSSFELDLDLSGAALELAGPRDAPALELDARARDVARVDGATPPPSADLHALGERFAAAADSAPQRTPELEPRAYRALQRAPRPRSSGRPQPADERVGSALSGAVRAWLPSLLVLTLLSLATALAVGYALDPDNPLQGLSAHASTLRDQPTQRAQDASLHPLLAATPAIARPALAAILRARIAGVHDLPVSFAASGTSTAHCTLVAHEEGHTEQRLSEVRATGRVVSAPREAQAELQVHMRALAATLGRPADSFTPVCLAL